MSAQEGTIPVAMVGTDFQEEAAVEMRQAPIEKSSIAEFSPGSSPIVAPSLLLACKSID
jgi:hypothetical protein